MNATTQKTKLARMTRRLYDARTPEKTRRDLSMRVAMIRAELGCNLDDMMAASEEEEVGS